MNLTESSEPHLSEIVLREMAVMFVRCNDDVSKFGALWQDLETRVGLKGRKFYGAFYEDAEEYRACVLQMPDDDPGALELEVGSLPGGTYLRARIRGEAPQIYEKIEPTFQFMFQCAQRDLSRPQIEFYRSHGEIDCLMPI